MAEQTLVAVYDTAAHADAAVQALKAANVPSESIDQHAAATSGTGVGTAGSAAPTQERGFWSSIFGGDSDDADTYSRSIESGSTVVTVKVPEQHVSRVSDILEAHDPIDFDERAASYGSSQSSASTATTAVTPAAAAAATAPMTTARSTAASPAMGTDETIKIVEERLTVGKRAVNRGGARVRTYVVETPVEEQVRLRDETVRVERRPVTDGRPVTDADFKERSLEMRETDEEAVVGKTARVVEEIGLRKDVSDRVETVRDTVRRTEVDIDDSTDVNRTAGATGVAGSVGKGGANPPGTAASRAMDRTTGSNLSGANPGGDAPDGTPGNPPGTQASRAVDKTLGTNVSGANPTRKP